VLSINTNSGALLAANAAKNAQKQMNEAMTRLSTGKRINSAKDDPGSLSVAIRMTAEISGLSVSLRNANDAQSAIDTTEAALNEVHTLLLRMRELAVQAATETVTSADRAALDSEITALETEITRIGASTTWGGINLLDGSFSNGKPIVFQIGPRDGDNIAVTLGFLTASATSGNASDGQGQLALTSGVTTQTIASGYISTIDGAISIVSNRRGGLGAVSNRLDSTITNLTNMKTNIETARGQIEDTDYAIETAKLARAQILMQAAMAMLSQANASKNQMLKLING
jgi:flagellin